MSKKYLGLIKEMKVNNSDMDLRLKAISSDNINEIEKWFDHHESGNKVFYEKLLIKEPSKEVLEFISLFESFTRKEDKDILFNEEESCGLFNNCISC